MSYPKNDRTSSGALQPPKTFFGHVLDDILGRRGLSARAAERMCGISPAHLSRIRHGYHGGTFSVIAALESGLSLSDDDVSRLLIAGYDDAKERPGKATRIGHRWA